MKRNGFNPAVVHYEDGKPMISLTMTPRLARNVLDADERTVVKMCESIQDALNRSTHNPQPINR